MWEEVMWEKIMWDGALERPLRGDHCLCGGELLK